MTNKERRGLIGIQQDDSYPQVENKKESEEKMEKKENISGRSSNALQNLIQGTEPKRSTRQHGVYLDKDIEKILDNLLKDAPKGAKSDVVNDSLRALFQNYGLLTKDKY